MVKMKALDTFHASNVRADNLVEGDVFDISESDAKKLENRGLAKRYTGSSDVVNAEPVADPNPASAAITNAADNAATDLNADAKAMTVSRNKMEAAPENKAASVTARPARKGK